MLTLDETRERFPVGAGVLGIDADSYVGWGKVVRMRQTKSGAIAVALSDGTVFYADELRPMDGILEFYLDREHEYLDWRSYTATMDAIALADAERDELMRADHESERRSYGWI